MGAVRASGDLRNRPQQPLRDSSRPQRTQEFNTLQPSFYGRPGHVLDRVVNLRGIQEFEDLPAQVGAALQDAADLHSQARAQGGLLHLADLDA